MLSYLGRVGRSTDDVHERFPSFEMTRLTRAQLVEVITSDGDAEVEPHSLPVERYVLTDRGAAAIGLAPQPESSL